MKGNETLRDQVKATLLFGTVADLNNQEVFIPLIDLKNTAGVRGALRALPENHVSRAVLYSFEDWHEAAETLLGTVVKTLEQEKHDCLLILDRANTDTKLMQARIEYINEALATYKRQFAGEANNAEQE